ncbi:MAG: elongation factor P [Candidatus Liptonbacteria bacterium]|nr:elongation factor P [Candidatus Liptonbacteria bacterium]
MLSINDLQNGIVVKIGSDPYLVMSVRHLHVGRGSSSVQTRIKNLRTGQVLERNFKPSDEFEEAEIGKMKSRLLYESRGMYWLDEIGNPKNRFSLTTEEIGDGAQFLKPNLEVQAIKFDDKIINIELPIKVDYKVVEAPPTVRGNTAQGGTKTVVIESGAKISAPLFINEGDIIRVNTQTGEYAERIEKF